MKNMLSFFKSYKKAIIGVILLLFLQTLGTLFIPTLTASIINNGIVNGDIPYILRTGGKMLILAALTGLFAIFGTYLSAILSSGVGRDIRNAIFTKAQNFSITDFNTIGTASMITRSTSDVTQIQQATLMSLQMLLPAPIMAIGGLVLAFFKNKTMGIIILITMIVFMFTAFILGKKAVPLFGKLQRGMDKINRVMREYITGARVIRAFNRTEAEQNRVNQSFDDYAGIAIKVNKIFAVMMPLVMLMLNLCTLCILWFGGIRVSQGSMAIGDIMAVIEYSFLILYYLIMGVMVFMMLPKAQACGIRISEVLNLHPTISDHTSFSVPDKNAPKLSFDAVTFAYPDAEEPVLSRLTFSCNPGEITAIIGGTGSGKSTIASLIPRFYDIQEGKICIDGIDISTYSQKKLREQIGFVPQKAFLFSGTIRDNLRFGNPHATDEILYKASQIAQADDFITELELGFDAPVAQGGNNFSGGQKQRLSIARALVKKPEIYVFDDSFSALDFKTDARLRAALKSEITDAAVILVAQRISSIMDANQIIVLDNGMIAGIGTHHTLLKNCTVYKEIAESQLSKEELQ
ncbi:MAG: ABC transporter ATP-binding protein [Eubacterium sp.]